jgi:hypothetical protein
MLKVRQSGGRSAGTDGAGAAERTRFMRAALLGSLVALALYLAMLAGPDPSLVRDNGLLGSFYDVQARALLDGHLDVDSRQVRIEGFRVDGRTQIYFGLFPTLLRLPVLAVSDGLDGRLTQMSMLIAFAVLMTGTAQLHWRVRSQVRPGEPFQRTEPFAAFLFQVAVGVGAIPLYLASEAVVYHEAEIWGAALAVAALAAVVGVISRSTATRIAVAGALAALALNARFSVGLGPVAALALLTAGSMAQLVAYRGGRRVAGLVAAFGPRTPNGPRKRTPALLAVAVLVPVGLHAAVNTARFDSAFGIPIDKQVQSRIDANRRSALAANDGTIFGLKFVPTTLVQAVRPDAVGSVRAFPFVGLPSEPASVIGDVRFDTIEPSLSAVTSMPALFGLTLVGLVAGVRRRALRPLIGVLVATAVGFGLTLTIAFITTRYLADLLPFLVFGAALGLQALTGSTGWRAYALGGVAMLTCFGIVVNGGAGLVVQRLLYHASEPERADFVRTQDDVDRLLGRSPGGVSAGPALPTRATGSPGDLFLLDRCAGLYVQGLQNDWLPVERTERTGFHRLRVRFAGSPRPAEEALLSLGSGGNRVIVSTRTSRDGTVFSVRLGRRVLESSPPILMPGQGPIDMVVSVDRFSGQSGVFTAIEVGGRRVVTVLTPDVRRARGLLGEDPGGLPPFSGTVERLKLRAPACRAIAARAGLL